VNAQARFWAVVPAAGVGRRMGGDTPKQYLQIGGRTVIEHTLGRLLGHPRIESVVVALSEDDGWWPDLPLSKHPKISRVEGGAERCHSVLSGLRHLSGKAAADDWVLVHDAARPCLRRSDLDRLIETLKYHLVGGLLAVPVHDTVKRANRLCHVEETLPREALWRAYTPQMFRLGSLLSSIEDALAEGHLVTDESSAVEFAGLAPLLVEGHSDNIKITRPEDLELAKFFLERIAREEE
jgi:2-C-methyl-D-erythritol 4-phosphate cytidylyltransferase